MSEPRVRPRRIIWAPRALVVISCALALLAMQPVGVSPVARNRPAVLKDAGTTFDGATWETARRTQVFPARPSVKATGREEAFFASTQRLHILATVEILQRLLITELHPAQQQLISPFWLAQECPAIVTAPAVAPTQVHSHVFLSGPQPEAEKAFAMAHCQLAPPIS